jgi:MFS transporter, PAT family, beta-lactamase induction signal transducer AmpG
MGVSSGLPLPLSGATLKLRLTEAHLDYGPIGLFTLVGLAYSVKFLWAPLLDRVSVPALRRLGRRRSWLIVIQLALIAALIGLGFADPVADLTVTAVWAAVVGFLSASQDIVIDAYRIELLAPAEQGAGVAATQIGYRIGLIASGAGALYLAAALGWQASFLAMAAILPIGGIAALLCREPAPAEAEPLGPWLATTILAPFADFIRRHDSWLLILCFVPLYRFGDAVAGEMAPTFYLWLGFSKIDYASVSKVFGVAAALLGVSLGGVVVYRAGIMRALLLGGVLQIFANLTYIGQLWAGASLPTLVVTIGIEQVTGGLCGAALVAYLSGLCSPAYTATQYALLSALFGLVYRIVGSGGGYFIDRFGWAAYFLASALLVLPSLAILLVLMRRTGVGVDTWPRPA